MRIYISGKVTGTSDYRFRFLSAERLLRSKGFDVINPVAVNAMLPKDTDYMQYINMGLQLLSDCDALYLLEGWKDSKGASLEKAYAECMGIHILHEDIAERVFNHE